MSQFPPDGYAERPRHNYTYSHDEVPEGNLRRMGRLRFFVWTASIGLCFLSILTAVGLATFLLRLKNWDVTLLLWWATQWLCFLPLCIRRAYDMDFPSWTAWIAPLPPVLLVWLLMPGSQGHNRYGPPPPASGSGTQKFAWVLGFIYAVILWAWVG